MATDLIPLIVRANQTELTFRADMMAVDDRSSELQLLSCVGAGVAIRALAAALRTKAPVEISARHVCGNMIGTVDQYRFRYAKLALDDWHLLAINADPRLMLESSDAALWQLLSSDEFTTPLMYHWVPWIRDVMMHQTRTLRLLELTHNCRPLRCMATDKHLDEIVKYGLKEGHLSLEDHQ